MICKTCNVPLVKSMALQDKILYIQSTDEFGGTQLSVLTQPVLIECLKCAKCGYSITI